jgi:hypothetical protein
VRDAASGEPVNVSVAAGASLSALNLTMASSGGLLVMGDQDGTVSWGLLTVS